MFLCYYIIIIKTYIKVGVIMLDELVRKIKTYNSAGDFTLIEIAYNFALSAHQGQKRISGEEYISHPAAVAMILADLSMDNTTIVAGILHDVIEDTRYSFEDVKDIFGEEIAMLVDGVTKLGKLEYRTKEEQQAESLRKMFIAMAKDIRVILIKLADRLHNLRTINYMSRRKQIEKATETLEIYSPIAHRLGISKMKWEMEDLSLRYLEPEKYKELGEKVAKKREEREEYINDVISAIRDKNKEMGIESQIEGRPKNFYSIYKKMYLQNKTFEQIFDITAVRVIVDNVKDCYGVLGIVHTLWKPIPGRFKDYIAMPKPNMYQSIHTTVIGPDGEPFEVQIRTWEMHKTSEFGIAAHWKYKEGKTSQNEFDEKFKWLRQMLEWQNEVRDTKEFMETLKIDLVIDEVYVFTPKGDVIDLPVDSTPIDFAYKIHSAVGNKCIGAKINGKIVPLDYRLQNGDIVEIITSAASNGPSRDWLKLVKSSQAKNKIRQWFRRDKREENIQKGKELFDKEIKKLGFTQAQIIKSECLEQTYKKLGFHLLDDLYASLGYGGLTLNQVMMRLKDEIRKSHKVDSKIKEELEKEALKTVTQRKKRTDTGIKVKGIDNVLVRFSKCCNPVPGDDIIGYITKGRGVSIHRKDCPNAKSLLDEPERLIEVEWNIKSLVSYNADLQIKANDRQGLLAEITSIINENHINIVSFYSKTSKDRIANISFILEINDIEQLNKLIKKFKRIEGVMDVYRAK